LVRELNFTGGLDENPYMHLQDFEEICATLMISGMNHDTFKWKAFPFSLTGWAKQWYKLYVSSCHSSWVILKDQFCFAFFSLSKIIDLRNEVLNFAQKEGESLGVAWSLTYFIRSRVIYSRCYVYVVFCARVGYRIC
jgi:hypothetical protein